LPQLLEEVPINIFTTNHQPNSIYENPFDAIQANLGKRN
jgi:hypothetical protein